MRLKLRLQNYNKYCTYRTKGTQGCQCLKAFFMIDTLTFGSRKGFEIMLINLSLGAILFISGAAMFLFPPKKINGFYGYRTHSSMKNEWSWKTANRYCSQLMIVLGIILMIIAVITDHFGTTAVCTILSFVLINILIENKLKKM